MYETATAGEFTAETAWNESEYPQGEGGPQAEDEWAPPSAVRPAAPAALPRRRR